MKLSLREWRKEMRYSQSDVANLLSKKINQPITQDYISRIENGQHPLYNIGVALKKISNGKIEFV